jgi:hypothetical protein
VHFPHRKSPPFSEETRVYSWLRDDPPEMRGEIRTCGNGSGPLAAKTIDGDVSTDVENMNKAGIVGLGSAIELQLLGGKDLIHICLLVSSVLYR